MKLPEPHGDKLQALLRNSKLPAKERQRVGAAHDRYKAWARDLGAIDHGPGMVQAAVRLLNDYRNFLDLELVFDSEDDFLYRQKGQLKIDNTVIEEFLPRLVRLGFPNLSRDFSLGPNTCFSALYFTSSAGAGSQSPGAQVRRKNQDFSLSRKLFLRASFHQDHSAGVDHAEANLGYLCAECKTNLDKTMFQEASATAHDLKVAMPGARYLLLCEWLDMPPLNTAGTDVDEVLILRKAKRLGSQVRAHFATSGGRRANRAVFADHLMAHPFATDVFERFLAHVGALLEERDPDESLALERGYF